MKKAALFIFGFVIVTAISYVYFTQIPTKQAETAMRTQDTETMIEEVVEVEEGPYDSLTIPYLRRQTYDTEEVSIGEIYQQTNTYTSYFSSYESEDDIVINALLTRPIGKSPRGGFPAIVFVHGFIPPDNYVTQEKYVDYVNYLAREGFVVFKIDLRGHGDSEGKPSGAYFSSDYVSDILFAKQALGALDFVDEASIGLWGHSMSGNLVMRAMAADLSIKASVIWAGAVYSYTDFRKYGLSDSSFNRNDDIPERILSRTQKLFETVGQISEDNEFWRQVAPASYLDDITGSIQLHHAASDPVVSVGYSRDFVDLMDKANVKHEIYEYPSGDHNLLEAPYFSQAMERTVEFFEENL